MDKSLSGAIGALEHNGDSDYTLPPDSDHAWITVNNISVYVKRTEIGVEVSLCAAGCEGHKGSDLGIARASFGSARIIKEKLGIQ